MSATSYQTAPPRELMIATVLCSVKLMHHKLSRHASRCSALRVACTYPARCPIQFGKLSLLQLWTFASIHNLRRINGGIVLLFLENASIFADQEIHAPRGFVFIRVDAVLVGRFSAPIAQQREGDPNGIGKSFIGEGTIHAHTQDLGVGSFQLFQILLEVFHLLGSTTGKSEDIKREHYLLFSAILA